MSYDSILLAGLGNVVENIEENYTSEKLFLAADMPLYQGVTILLEHTRLLEEFLAAYYVHDTRKMLWSLDNDTKVNKHFTAIFTGNGGKRVENVMALHLNRELVMLPMTYAVGHVKPYVQAVGEGSDEAQQIAELLQFHEPWKDKTAILLRLQGEHERFLLMRESILQKYYRLLVKEVHKEGIGGVAYVEDLALEYYFALLQSFARFNIESGTYTSYVTAWFRNARSKSKGGLEMGTAFTIPNSARVKIARGKSDLINYAVPNDKVDLDSMPSKDGFDLDGFDIDAMNQIISYYDRTGLYRMIHDLEFDPRYLLEENTD